MNLYPEKYRMVWVSIFLACFLFVAVAFSFLQSLWVDESTQLSGLTLSLIDMYRWLSGLMDNPFLVPPDRMPVLSYFLGAAWVSVWGYDVLSLRWLSVACVFLGIIAVAVYFYRQKQYSSLWIILAFLCLSPNLIIIAVEIRAYALFFLLSSVVAVIYYQIILAAQKDEPVYVKLVLMSLFMALAVNTHFFGFLMAGSVFCSYLVLMFLDKRFVVTFKYILTAVVILIVATLGVLQPVIASIGMSSINTEGGSIVRPAIKLIYRLVVHQSMGEIPLVPWLALLVCYTSILFSLVKYFTLEKLALTLVLAIGFVVAFAANIVLVGFDALAPHYNIWMLPFLAVLLGLCIGEFSSIVRGSLLVFLCTVFGFGQYNMVSQGEKYAHTRFNEIEDRVQHYREKGNRVAVIFNRQMAKTWFASIYRLPNTVAQYAITKQGYDDLYTRPIEALNAIEQSRFDIVIVAYGKDRLTGELLAAEASAPLADGSPVYQQFPEAQQGWQIVDSGSYMAQESADILVYKKSP